MFSTLSRGYSSWTGELDVYGQSEEKTTFPEVGPHEEHPHKHGVTVTPRTAARHHPYPPPPQSTTLPHPYSAPPPSSHLKEDGCLDLPKTYLTRKGALLLFSSPEIPPEKDHVRAKPAKMPRKRKQELIDLSLKLGTLERLSMSVLQYGDQGFDRENTSISDKENRWFLKFLHGVETPQLVEDSEKEGSMLIDSHSQPGGDLKFYLQDLKQRASSRGYGRESVLSSRARSQELRDILQQLEDAWPAGQPQPLSQAPTYYLSDGSGLGEEFFYPRSPSISSESSRAFSGRARVLSSHKLTASLKSLSYLGRPQSTDPEQTQGVTSPELTLPQSMELTHTRRAKSAYWSRTVDSTPVPPDLAKGHKQAQLIRERQQVSAPDVHHVPALEESSVHDVIAEEDSMTEGGLSGRSRPQSRNISIQVSSTAGAGGTGTAQGLHGTVDEDRTSMVSSSVQQEEDATMAYDDAEEAVDDAQLDSEWPADVEEEDTGLTKPLQPQYSGVLQETETEMLEENEEEGVLQSEQGSRPGSRVGSVASTKTRDGLRPSSVMSSRAASRAGMVPEGEEIEEVDQEGLDELIAEENKERDQSDATLLEQANQQQDENQEKRPTYSIDREPETLVSIQKDGSVGTGPHSTKSSSSIKSGGVGDGGEGEGEQVLDVSVKVSEASPEASEVGIKEDENADLKSVTELEAPASEALAPSTVPPSEIDAASSVGAPPEMTVKIEVRETVPQIAEPEAGVADNKSVKSEADAEGASQPRPPSVVESEHHKDTLSVKTEENNLDDVYSTTTSNADPDFMNYAMVEAGFMPMPPPSPYSRSASPAPSSVAAATAGELKVTLPTPGLDSASATSVGAPTPKEKVQATPTVTKPEATKVTAKPPIPHPPAKTKSTPRQTSLSKGGKSLERKGSKAYVKAMDITSVKTDEAEKAKPKEEKKKKEPYRPPPPPPRPKAAAEKKDLLIPEHMRDVITRDEAEAQNELDNELMRMHKAMDDALGMKSLITTESEGLTEEDLQRAEQALRERMEEAHRKMQEALDPGSQAKSPKTSPRKPEVKGKGKKGKKVKIDPKEAEELARKEAAKQQRELERQKRLDDAAALQELIKSKGDERKIKELEAAQKAADLQEQVEWMRQEEEAISQAEEDARLQMAAIRKTQREERDARRKVDLEKKKQWAQEKREREKKMMEAARNKEQEMLERIADAEMRRAIREEEERKRDEEDRLATERYEDEVREAQRIAEEEEARLQELEKQAEEEAFQRIQREREDAEKQRIELEYQARKMAEEEDRQRQAMIDEEKRLEDERRRLQMEEHKRIEEERARLKELQRMEDEARQKMRAEIEQRREWALKRREVNVDRRRNLDSLSHSQSMTPPWQFSYFIHWPKENYTRPMGQPMDEVKKKKPKPA